MKKFISFITCLILALSSVTPVFADGAVTVSAAPAMDQIVFTGETIVMTLDDVVARIMTTGSAIQTAELNKKSDEAIANGYSESYDAIESTWII